MLSFRQHIGIKLVQKYQHYTLKKYDSQKNMTSKYFGYKKGL